MRRAFGLLRGAFVLPTLRASGLLLRASALLLLACACVPGANAGDGTWLDGVGDRERGRANPYAESSEAVAAGAILYGRRCASCHGASAQGVGSRPSLRSTRVQTATDGELHWLLTNGDLRRGMPSWSHLPDAQRWQLVRYLHALPVDH
ncbi:MAG: cytochrome c [Acidobacteriota bacterium]|nr:cytochrome c [Acidobacteriota bacterium]